MPESEHDYIDVDYHVIDEDEPPRTTPSRQPSFRDSAAYETFYRLAHLGQRPPSPIERASLSLQKEKSRKLDYERAENKHASEQREREALTRQLHHRAEIEADTQAYRQSLEQVGAERSASIRDEAESLQHDNDAIQGGRRWIPWRRRR